MCTAIITPYYKETRKLLLRCIGSVHNQTVHADHFLIADGYPQDWIEGVRHIRLDRSHHDAGNVARGIGALLAIAEKYEAIGLLDADNWLEPDHVETCLVAASAWKFPAGPEASSCDYVVAKRTLRRPDESVMPLADNWPYDTSCLFFLPGAFSVLPQWATIPTNFAAIGDRYFYGTLKQFKAAYTDHPTVNYHNLYAASYRALGEPLPPGAKENVRI